jgi:hypothetical protein
LANQVVEMRCCIAPTSAASTGANSSRAHANNGVVCSMSRSSNVWDNAAMERHRWITLHLFPSTKGVQHCEIAGTTDTLETYAEKIPKFLRGFATRLNYQTIVRTIRHDAKIHPIVLSRFNEPSVVQCAKVGKYRPDALRDHDDFKRLY